jgi:hypothetical protein
VKRYPAADSRAGRHRKLQAWPSDLDAFFKNEADYYFENDSFGGLFSAQVKPNFILTF